MTGEGFCFVETVQGGNRASTFPAGIIDGSRDSYRIKYSALRLIAHLG